MNRDVEDSDRVKQVVEFIKEAQCKWGWQLRLKLEQMKRWVDKLLRLTFIEVCNSPFVNEENLYVKHNWGISLKFVKKSLSEVKIWLERQKERIYISIPSLSLFSVLKTPLSSIFHQATLKRKFRGSNFVVIGRDSVYQPLVAGLDKPRWNRIQTKVQPHGATVRWSRSPGFNCRSFMYQVNIEGSLLLHGAANSQFQLFCYNNERKTTVYACDKWRRS